MKEAGDRPRDGQDWSGIRCPGHHYLPPQALVPIKEKPQRACLLSESLGKTLLLSHVFSLAEVTPLCLPVWGGVCYGQDRCSGVAYN